MKLSCSTIVSVVLLFQAMCVGQKTGSTEEGTQYHSVPVPQCSVCWSTESAAQCQHAAKSEACNDEQLNTTVTNLRLINPSSLAAENSTSGAHRTEHRHYGCFTLSAATGTGDSRKVFYAKGCTVAPIDPCIGWAKEKGDCALCSGINCNAAAPVEQVRGEASMKGKTNHSSSGTIGIYSSWTMFVVTGAITLVGCVTRL
uniref:Salivary secreted peptide n=1 Tax=Anopheles atroparvus TaxID=41427 RepID=A0AAG5D0L8_ANOAO